MFKTRLLAAALALSAAHSMTMAQTWPDKPVRFVVPYAPGGTTDFAARMVAERLTHQTGKSFFVENKTGASGTIGTSQVAKSAPDGTTFLVNDTTYAMLPSLFAKLPWDHANDLMPVTTLAVSPVVLVVAANSPFKTAQELFEHARRNPGKLNFGSGGNGSSTHLSAEVLKKEGKLFITHIPYKGAGDAMVGLLGNQVDLLITAAPTAVPQVQGGKVRALAVTGDKPLASLPGVPTFKDVGLPGYTVTNWFGLAAPKGTSKEVVEKLQAEVNKALADPKVIERFQAMGARPGGIPSAEFASFIRSETKVWTDISKAAGVRPD
jgi:tripartite-type tricarboxylate transporter receptor subunit TctC